MRGFTVSPAGSQTARLYATVRLFVNFFQPSFKLAEKAREGARVRKRYHPPATPCQRLLADPRTSQEVRDRVTASYATLDPVRLPSDMRTAQQQLVDIADRPFGRASNRRVLGGPPHGMERRRGAADCAAQAETKAGPSATGPTSEGH
jgi:hypothetical protein